MKSPYFALIFLGLSAPAWAGDPWATIHRFSNPYYEPGRKVIVPASCPSSRGECQLEAEVVGLRPEKALVEVRFRSGPLKGTGLAVPLAEVMIPEGCTPSREFYYCVGMEVSGPGNIQGKVIGVGADNSVAVRLQDGSSRALAASILTRRDACTNVERCFAEMEAHLWKKADMTHVKVVDPIHPPEGSGQTSRPVSGQVNDSRNRRKSASGYGEPSSVQGFSAPARTSADRAM